MSSPVFERKQTKTITVDFATALLATTEGSQITRIEWEDASIYGFMKSEVLHIHNDKGDHQWVLQQSDILATDWIVLNLE